MFEKQNVIRTLIKKIDYICKMKTILLIILLSFSTKIYSQTSDILFVPDQNTLVATYNNNVSTIGFYLGAYYLTSFPQPYIYTTPFSILNRAGISINNPNNAVSLMGGVFIENYVDSISLKPDLWLKINPIRLVSGKRNTIDFSLGVNYMEGFRYAVGISIPFGGIY